MGCALQCTKVPLGQLGILEKDSGNGIRLGCKGESATSREMVTTKMHCSVENKAKESRKIYVHSIYMFASLLLHDTLCC